MGEAVLSCTDLAMATDPATSSLLNVTLATAPTLRTLRQHDSTVYHELCLGTVPHTDFKHDEGHIHRASPVRGLPPEKQQIKGTRDTKHSDHECDPTATKEASPITKRQGLRQDRCELGNPTTAQLTAIEVTPISVVPSINIAPPPPDVKDRLEAAISVIDVGVDDQDH